MQDRPDLIQSELAGLAFDSLQQVFRKQDILMMFETDPLPLMLGQPIWIVIDPAAGGPQSDYAVVSVCRVKGCVVVRAPPPSCANCCCVMLMVVSSTWSSRIQSTGLDMNMFCDWILASQAFPLSLSVYSSFL